MEDNIISAEKIEKKKPSSIENLGKVSLQVGEKLGKAVTEWFTGKPPSEEEKIRRTRMKELRLVQEEAQFQKDLELARNGKYVIPEKPKQEKKKAESNMFSNLGKRNPLEDFNHTKSLGSTTPTGKSGIKIPSKEPDFGLKGFAGAVNPMKKNKGGK